VTRFVMLTRKNDAPLDFDFDQALEQSKENPVFYVQYAHARIAGILRNADGATPSAEPPLELAPEERDLVKRLAEFTAVVAEATERRGPHAIPTYAIRVADDFHRFYTRHKVLGSEAEPFRLGLITATKAVIARSLDLIGVEAPDTM
jgi:arginyl-tRNA synthetase